MFVLFLKVHWDQVLGEKRINTVSHLSQNFEFMKIFSMRTIFSLDSDSFLLRRTICWSLVFIRRKTVNILESDLS